jgi:pyruvate, water dikinase
VKSESAVFAAGAFASALVAGSASCLRQETRSCDADSILLTVRDDQGTRPPTFQVTFSWGDDGLARATCDGPDGTNAEVVCTDAGATLKAGPAAVHVVVKAPGLATVEAEPSVRFVHAPVQDGRCDNDAWQADIELTLAALPAFVRTTDYATGFSAAPGLADFASLAADSITEAGATFVVKFFIADIKGCPTVYFQNTRLHPLHYEFFRAVLRGAMSMSQYETVTYFGEDRENLAGALIFYPERRVPSAAWQMELQSPLTIEFFPSDNLSPELARLAYRLLEERLLFVSLAGDLHRLAYMPATDAREAELVAREREFARSTSLWLGRAEIYGNVTVQYLNPGKACGTLRRLTPEDLATTPLSYRDVVILTRLPNELPLVGGTISEELQTPLAHVNVAARARGTPNIALLGAATDPRVAPFLDKLVCFEVDRSSFELYEVALAEAQAFWATRIPPTPFVPQADLTATGLFDFATIGFSDAVKVGVKAANLAELRKILGDTIPDGFAVPFHYYDDFMKTTVVAAAVCADAQNDCLVEGRATGPCQTATDLCGLAATDGLTLDDYLGGLLVEPEFVSDTLTREATLDGLRYLIDHAAVDTAFAAELDAKVEALVGTAKVRLRSSTNAEDLEQFSGAGLYESFSAQVGTDHAPSLRIGKVWASTFTRAAFEERAYWNIDQHATKMGVAVHHSFPDEVANGVIITQSIADPAVTGFYVNVQVGEVSVTNPTDGVLPEIFTIVPVGGTVAVVRDRFSSLSPDAPIMTDAEIRELYVDAALARDHFAVLYGADLQTFALDLEFKLIPPERKLIIKQARPYYQR